MNNKLISELYSKIDNQEKIIRELQEENQDLKADYGNKAQVERDLLKIENNHLQDQLDQALKDYDKVMQNWEKLIEWLKDENNQQYSKYIYNYSINNWILNKMKNLEKDSNE